MTTVAHRGCALTAEQYRLDAIRAVVYGGGSILAAPQLAGDRGAVLAAIRAGDITAYPHASTDLQVDPGVIAAELTARVSTISWVPSIVRYCPTVTRSVQTISLDLRRAMLADFATSAAGENERAAMRRLVRVGGPENPATTPQRVGPRLASAMKEPLVATDLSGDVYTLDGWRNPGMRTWVNTTAAAELVAMMEAASGLTGFRLVTEVDNEFVDATAARLLAAPSREVMLEFIE